MCDLRSGASPLARVVCAAALCSSSISSGFGQLDAGPALVIQRSGSKVELRWTDSLGDFALEQSGRLGSLGRWLPITESPVQQGDQFSMPVQLTDSAQYFRLRLAFSRILSTSPWPEEDGVAVARETILRFEEPLAENTVLNVDKFHATFGGRRILSRVELSTDRQTATLFYGEDLPASARINVNFDTSGLKDAKGLSFDGDGDGVAGGVFQFAFVTLGNTPLFGTAVIGHVFASELSAGGTNRPLEGVTVTVDGAEETLRTVTDTNGFFRLQPSPAGRFFVHVDGRTAVGSVWPNGAYYPFVGKAWEAVPGKSDNLAGGNGEIFLPLIQADALKPVSTSADTVIKPADSVMAANPAFAGVALTVPANSLFADNGTRGGKVGIAPVPPDRLPEPLPPGLNMPIVITVQTDGAMNFDRPAPICFPNLPDPVLKVPLPAGSKQSLVSFNHDKGKWEAVGTMTVSADGKTICSDPGSGILQPGWHGVGCPPSRPPLFRPPPEPPPDPPECLGPSPFPKELSECFESANDLKKDCLDAARTVWLEELSSCLKRFDVNGNAIELGDCIRFWKRWKATKDQQCRVTAEQQMARCKSYFCAFEPPGQPGNGPPVPSGPSPILMQSIRPSIASTSDLVDAKIDQISALLAQNPPPDESVLITQLEQFFAELNALTGNSTLGFLSNSIAASQRARAGLPAIPFLNPGSVPPYPVKYAAQVLRPSGLFILRGETEPYLNYTIFVPRDGILVGMDFYDPVGDRFGHAVPDFRAEAQFHLPRVLLSPLTGNESDADADRLPDMIEEIYGTNPDNPDTDGDGTRDGQEIVQGTNPLDGFPMNIGLLASVKTLGSAVDVTAFNNFAVVAEGAAGISVFDTEDFFNPVRAVQIDTPGTAGAVASAGSWVAVADGPAGLAIIQILTASSATLIHQVPLPFPAVSVTIAGGLAYAGLDPGRIAVVDLASGSVLEIFEAGNSSVFDLIVIEDTLYALLPPNLMAISLGEEKLRIAAQLESPGTYTFMNNERRVRLTGGNGLLYAASGIGFNIFSITNPLVPVRIVTHVNQPQQFGWKQIVPNGSGLGVAAAGPNTAGEDALHDVYLQDLRPGGTNSAFLTLIPTPGLARALAIFNGLAYVADGAGGLQVINYIQADILNKAPMINLKTSFPSAPAQAESRVPARLYADVTDDVQVRNVEFYFDGVWVATDGSFPFELHFITPMLSPQKTNFTVRAKATDTGGNFTWSEEILAAIVPDAVRPTVKRVSPRGGGEIVDRITVFFSELVDSTHVDTNTFQIKSTGADGIPGTPDDASISGITYTVNASTLTAEALFPSPLPDGHYFATLTTGITDLGQNGLLIPVFWEFRVGAGVFWAGPAGGDWNNPNNWSTGIVPGTNDHVVVDFSFTEGKVVSNNGTIAVASLLTLEDVEITGGSLSITGGWTAHGDVISSGAITVGSLSTLADFETTGGSLIVAGNWTARSNVVLNGATTVGSLSTFENTELKVGSLTVSNGWTAQSDVILNGGALRNGTLNLTAGATLRATKNFSSLLHAMTVNGDIVMTPGPDPLHPETLLNLRGGLALNGTLTMGSSSYLGFNENQTLVGGIIEFTGTGATIDIPASATVTFGGGVTVRGRTGTISGGGRFINQGKISADVADGHLQIRPTTWTHTGTAEVLNGAQLTFGGNWNGTGPVSVQNGSFNLAGQFGPLTTPITKTATGTVRITGVGNLQNSTLTLNAASGSWFIEGGALRNGTLTLTEGVTLLPTRNLNSLLQQMTVNGNIAMIPGPNAFAAETFLTLRGGLMLNGTLAMGSSSVLRFDDSQTLPSGTIEFTGTGATVDIPANVMVNFGAGVTVRGSSGTISGGGTLINHGKISGDVADGHLKVQPVTWTHNGMAEVQNGAQLTFGGAWNGTGSVAVQKGAFNLAGQFGPLTTPITKTATGTVRVTGVGNLQNSTLTLNAATGSWYIEGGTLRNGTLTLTEGAALLPTRNGNSLLQQMTVTGDIHMIPGSNAFAADTYLNLRGGLTLNGTLAMGSSAVVRFEDSQTLSGGTIEFTGTGATVDIPASSTVIFGAGVTLRGRTGTLSGGGTLLSQAKISADTAEGHLQIQPAIWTHNGTAEVLNGGQLTFGGTWSGSGSVAVQNGNFNLGGQFGPMITPITKTANGTVRITGVGNLQNSTLTLNAASGSWFIEGGSLRNGTLNLTEGSILRLTSNGNSLLQQMTVNGDIVMNPGPNPFFPDTFLKLRGGLTLNGTLVMGSSAYVRFDESQTLAAGTIEFIGTGATVEIPANSTATFGAGVTVRGGTGAISGGGTLMNQGKISADRAGGTIRVQPASFVNTGQMEAINGGILIAPGFP